MRFCFYSRLRINVIMLFVACTKIMTCYIRWDWIIVEVIVIEMVVVIDFDFDFDFDLVVVKPFRIIYGDTYDRSYVIKF